jgi:CO/xanthine dehydrogenase Mo-binding subunit
MEAAMPGPGAPRAEAGEGPADGPKPGQRLDRWIRIEPDGAATLQTGKVEIGQGLHIALAQLVADELGLPFERVHVAPVDTATSPDEGVTAGSRSIEETGLGLHRLAAEVRHVLLEAAANGLGVPVDALRLADGVVAAPDGRRLACAELVAGDLLGRPFTGTVAPKAPGDRRLVGMSVGRPDLPGKVTGRAGYVQDLHLPGMLHGRVVRPPGPGARLLAFDAAAVRAMPGVLAVVHDGRFLGVVADREEQAIAALAGARRSATWDPGPAIPGVSDSRYLVASESDASVVSEHHDAPVAADVTRFAAEYTRPYLAHAAIAPSCAVAALDGDAWTVWAHSQGVFRLRNELARVLEVDVGTVRVIHAQGPGVYGHNGSDDAALDAVLLARAVPGHPVRVQWMRDDEFAWEPLGTPMVARLTAAIDGESRIVDWTHDAWGHGSGSRPSMAARPGVVSLLAARHLAQPWSGAPPMRSGDLRNATPLYVFPNQRITGHHVADAPLRTSSLRGLGAHLNVFAVESFMDEIAAAAGADPLEHRLRHLADPRARAVVEAAAALASWVPGQRAAAGRGRGIGFARYKDTSAYAAVVVDVEVDREVRVRKAWAAIDAGMVVSPDGLRNQVEGGITQAVSFTLHEAVRTEGSQVATRGWETYRTLRFSEAPEIEIVLLDRPEAPPLGAGEAFTGPTAGAIGNAVFDAIGLRVRDLPLSRDRLIAAMG